MRSSRRSALTLAGLLLLGPATPAPRAALGGQVSIASGCKSGDDAGGRVRYAGDDLRATVEMRGLRLSIRRRPEFGASGDRVLRGYLEMRPGRRWHLAAGELALDWGVGCWLASRGRFAAGTPPPPEISGRPPLRMRGSTMMREFRQCGVSLSRCGDLWSVAAFVLPRRWGAGASWGPWSLAAGGKRGQRPDFSSWSVGLILPAGRDPSRAAAARRLRLQLECAAAARGPAPSRLFLGGRGIAEMGSILGTVEGGFRWSAPAGFPAVHGDGGATWPEDTASGATPGDLTVGDDSYWECLWRLPALRGMRCALAVRFESLESRGEPLAPLGQSRRLELAGAFWSGAEWTLLLGSNLRHRCRRDPDAADRYVMLTETESRIEGRLRIDLTPQISFILRHRMARRAGELDPADDPLGLGIAALEEGRLELTPDETCAQRWWDRGAGSVTWLQMRWQQRRQTWAGLTLAATPGGDARGAPVPSRHPAGRTFWRFLSAGSWMLEGWCGRAVWGWRIEAVLQLRGGPAETPGRESLRLSVGRRWG